MISSEPCTVETLETETAWLEARRSGIGSSDAPAVLDVSPFQPRAALFAHKLGLEPAESTRAPWLEWGHLLEPVVADHYGRVTGRTVQADPPWTLRRSRQWPWMVATLDRIVVGPDPGPAPLEIKTAGAWRAEEWAEEPPLYVQVQVQHQLAVTGWTWASVAVLLGGHRFHWCDVARNDRFIERLVVQEREFVDRLARRELPPIDGSEATRDLLRHLYPRETTGLVVNLTDAEADIDAALQAANAELAKWKLAKEMCENQLRAALGEAEVGVLPGGRVTYGLKTVERKGYAVAPTTFRQLRRKEIR